jgi:hypothetical protein
MGIFLLSVALAASWPVAGCKHCASFPGSNETLRSPDARHEIRWREPRNMQDEHHLLLVDIAQGSEAHLLAFPRWVNVFWAPSSTRFAITNAWGSDESTVLVWPTLTSEPSDLLDQLELVERQQLGRWGTHHLYLEAVRWLDDTSLELHLWGYGESQIDRHYIYTVGSGFKRK